MNTVVFKSYENYEPSGGALAKNLETTCDKMKSQNDNYMCETPLLLRTLCIEIGGFSEMGMSTIYKSSVMKHHPHLVLLTSVWLNISTCQTLSQPTFHNINQFVSN